MLSKKNAQIMNFKIQNFLKMFGFDFKFFCSVNSIKILNH